MLWPAYDHPSDLAAIETVPLEDRGLPTSTYDLLVRAAGLWPERTALTVLPDGARWREPVSRTYAQVLAEVHRAANALHEAGVGRGDAVALMSPNCDELITATLAAQVAGIAAPINAGLSTGQIAELLRRSGARVMVTAGPDLDARIWSTARALAAAGAIDTLLLLRPTGTRVSSDPPVIDGVRVSYLDAAGGDATGFAGVAPTGHDLAALFHTGGTTGAPKLAAHTHTNEVTDAWMIAANSVLDDDSRVFAALPLFHVNALIVTVLAPMLRGQSVIWAGPAGYRDAELYGEFWKIVEHYSLAAMSAVPTVYSVLAQCPVDADISSLRVCMVGASMLPPAVRDGFESHTGVRLLEGYGLTEATCASARSFSTAPRPGSVGQRMPYQQIKTVRVAPDGRWVDLPDGEVGTIAISGPTVFAGYVVGRDADGFVLDGKGALVDGWLDTGDLGRVDPDGFVHLTGRAKDLIIRGGHNIDPAVIEDALLAHPAVTGAAAVASPDIHSGEVPVAYVTVTASAEVTEQQLLSWAAEHVVESAATPKSVTVIDALPVTDVGKPYKLALRADAARRVAEDAVVGVAGVEKSVHAVVEGGTVVVLVTARAGGDTTGVKAALDRLPVTWRLGTTS
ncbi:acyl-CoA synthetase [Rhodococcus pseudokoreensis]|uniref:Acyl-CoA synthetase n=1 Tax=Rhodococcus pseudokoreensis TaxID=2811421 RepID=A0A974WH47_9NOCA|nr:acyl-CoA synthetase [Rhodococcus pseudokoreensis]QSE95598.1 acyl-CoA synthetase [Rhodococcus pseudokoreensis]